MKKGGDLWAGKFSVSHILSIFINNCKWSNIRLNKVFMCQNLNLGEPDQSRCLCLHYGQFQPKAISLMNSGYRQSERCFLGLMTSSTENVETVLIGIRNYRVWWNITHIYSSQKFEGQSFLHSITKCQGQSRGTEVGLVKWPRELVEELDQPWVLH